MRSSHALLMLVPLSVLGQSAPPTEFPADATPIVGDALHARLSGKKFAVTPADGSTWRLEYSANGYMFIETSRGFRDTGTWKVEGDRACGNWQKSGRSCTEYRLKDEVLYTKRQSGEIIKLVSE